MSDFATHSRKAMGGPTNLSHSDVPELVPQQIWTAEPNGELNYVNQRLSEFLGRTVHELVEYGWQDAIHPDDAHRQRVLWDAAVRDCKPLENEIRMMRAEDQAYRWFITRAVPIVDDDGVVVRWFGTNTDITERKDVEVTLRQLALTAEKARSEAELANRLKDEFLATLSHELRTPLNAILGWCEMLLLGVGDEQARHRGLDIIRRNAKLQAQLIEDILDVSRIISGKLRLQMESVDLREVVRAAIDTLKPAAEAKNIKVSFSFDAAVGAIAGDAQRLQQVVWNLLSNAMKFTPQNGAVRIELTRVDNALHLLVEDTGKGITSDFLPYVFDRFRQADGSFARTQAGLGLGLAIVRHVVEMHGGTVSAESEGEGAGATFHVTLPCVAVPKNRIDTFEAEEAAEESQRLADSEKQHLAGLRVLVVEDEEDSRELMREIIAFHGADVTIVSSAREGLDRVREGVFDIMVSDIGMPGGDGLQFMEAVRTLPADQGGAIPAIALTAYAHSEEKKKALRAGYQLHMTKPFDARSLILAIYGLSKQR